MPLVKGAIGWFATGVVTRDAEEKRFGKDKQHQCVEFGLYLGENKDGEKKYLTCAAKFEWANVAEGIKKTDRVLVTGNLESWEWEGKTYTKLDVDFLLCLPKEPPKKENKKKPEQSQVPAEDFFAAGTISDDEDLPF